MVRFCKEKGLKEPDFIQEEDFRIIVWRPFASQFTGEESSQKSSQKIISLILSNKNITTEEIAKELNITRRAVAKQIAKLKQEKKIERIGPDKGGYWKVNVEKKK